MRLADCGTAGLDLSDNFGRIKAVLHIPVLRWGKPYESLEINEVMHFSTGEPIAKVSQANDGIIRRDMRQAGAGSQDPAGILLRDLIEMMKTAADLYENGTLPIGDGHADARRFRPPAVGQHGTARAHVPGQHGQELVRAARTWTRFSTA